MVREGEAERERSKFLFPGCVKCIMRLSQLAPSSVQHHIAKKYALKNNNKTKTKKVADHAEYLETAIERGWWPRTAYK